MSRQSSASAPSTMPTQHDPKTIREDTSHVVSFLTPVGDCVNTPSGQRSSTATDGSSKTASHNLASHIPSRNMWKFWSPARLAHRTQLKFHKCLESETGCYILISGISAAMVDPINDAFVHYGIRKQLRLTYEHDLASLMIKCTVGIPHERVSWSFVSEVTDKIRQIPGHNKQSYHYTGTATFSVPGKRSKESDGGLSPAGTRDGKLEWPSIVIEVGDWESLDGLRNDAFWWLTNSKGLSRMVIIIKISINPLGLRLERWELIDDENALSTRYRQPKIPGFKQYWEIDTSVPKRPVRPSFA